MNLNSKADCTWTRYIYLGIPGGVYVYNSLFLYGGVLNEFYIRSSDRIFNSISYKRLYSKWLSCFRWRTYRNTHKKRFLEYIVIVFSSDWDIILIISKILQVIKMKVLIRKRTKQERMTKFLNFFFMKKAYFCICFYNWRFFGGCRVGFFYMEV